MEYLPFFFSVYILRLIKYNEIKRDVLFMKASTQSLCNNILTRAYKEKNDITSMKLQKLLYYVCTKYAQETGIFPIMEYFAAWKYGPVIPSVYEQFKPFKAEPINRFARNAKRLAKIVDENANPIL